MYEASASAAYVLQVNDRFFQSLAPARTEIEIGVPFPNPFPPPWRATISFFESLLSQQTFTARRRLCGNATAPDSTAHTR